MYRQGLLCKQSRPRLTTNASSRFQLTHGNAVQAGKTGPNTTQLGTASWRLQEVDVQQLQHQTLPTALVQRCSQLHKQQNFNSFACLQSNAFAGSHFNTCVSVHLSSHYQHQLCLASPPCSSSSWLRLLCNSSTAAQGTVIGRPLAKINSPSQATNLHDVCSWLTALQQQLARALVQQARAAW